MMTGNPGLLSIGKLSPVWARKHDDERPGPASAPREPQIEWGTALSESSNSESGPQRDPT